MVMCKYFLRGTCRFGESCKNEHAYNAESTASVMRKKGEIDTNVLIKSVSNDMDKAEKGNQWPLSCYGPFQAKPCFPGFEDKSFEEIRLGIYEAEKNGTVEQYKQQLTQLLHEARMKMRSLQNPTAEATHVLQELYNANAPEQQTSNFYASASTFSNSPIQSNSVFNNTAGGSKSIFNNQTTPSYSFAAPENKSIFGNTAPKTNPIFAQATQQTFASGGGIFGGNQIQQQTQSFPATNIFKSANTSIFGAQQGTNNHQSPFGGAQPVQSSSNIFMQNNQPPNPFKQSIQAPAIGQSPFGAAPVQQPFSSNQTPSTTFTSNQTPSTFTSNQTPSTFTSNQPQPTFAQPQFGSVANQSPFGGSFTPNTNQTPFTSTPPNPNPTVFAQAQPSFTPFAGNQSTFPPTSTQTPFGANQSPFVAAPPPAATITENRSIFAQQASIGQNSQTSALDHSKSIFGSSQSTVVAAAVTRQDDPTVYSKLEALAESDVKSFEANTFEFGKIPDKPPTLQMCS